ncbi:FMN-binding glutamate synthase family protein [Nocardioides sp. dk4132]|uniref:FMN-binding glutamate synthase family protein n=1 Tax=unclassified Nocardioides TaxID=2615069 RepID=UPI001294F812|nr:MULTISPECIES: FMN-binding glutamate synthase family protein [unclassified Nocardioides]MQW74601.1 FMN-binding glutamate synthase family protein [Nocardioides sp. dk4132]QGA06517.1 FMN-binding glutamate synthase family protein [Nocardioides sp. dk884]
MKWTRTAAAGTAALGAVAVHDLVQRKHAILRNFPVIGHLRFQLERFGPELRQYIVTSNDEERPFSRDQRRWVYASAKGENSYFGFGTDNDIENVSGQVVIKHRTFAGSGAGTGRHAEEGVPLPAAKVIGAARARAQSFRPASVVNISGMSFGSLSRQAIEALNRGAAATGALQNTGEGGLSPYHRNGGDLVFQIGTSYFGCRDDQGHFDLARLKDLVASAPVRALEIKLSQGAKPGLGGMLPGAKVTSEIAEIRGITAGRDCASPSRHAVFDDVDSMLDFVELLAAETGLPVGIKSAVGDLTFWDHLVEQMAAGGRGVDFVNIDGGEGGTGAAPLVFADSVAYPFRIGFAEVYRRFAAAGLSDDVTFIGAGKLGLPENAVVAFALGADMVNVGREAMLSIGCIQAQKCHTDKCPTGVATQDPRLARGLDPTLKADRAAHYLLALRRDLLKVAEAVGVPHPALIGPDDIDLAEGVRSATSLREVYGYQQGWGVPGPHLRAEIEELMRATPRPVVPPAG